MRPTRRVAAGLLTVLAAAVPILTATGTAQAGVIMPDNPAAVTATDPATDPLDGQRADPPPGDPHATDQGDAAVRDEPPPQDPPH
jgi:hypothetical protein